MLTGISALKPRVVTFMCLIMISLPCLSSSSPLVFSKKDIESGQKSLASKIWKKLSTLSQCIPMPGGLGGLGIFHRYCALDLGAFSLLLQEEGSIEKRYGVDSEFFRQSPDPHIDKTLVGESHVRAIQKPLVTLRRECTLDFCLIGFTHRRLVYEFNGSQT
ncbi:hypothetical protein WG66_013286 [Moniliophthora roreri]|nr:hypothetical protein WG66_013286 [Moniliophthora roreri]